MDQIKSELKNQIEKRRTFAIISHPDAGKTTLTGDTASISWTLRGIRISPRILTGR